MGNSHAPKQARAAEVLLQYPTFTGTIPVNSSDYKTHEKAMRKILIACLTHGRVCRRQDIRIDFTDVGPGLYEYDSAVHVAPGGAS